MHDTNLCQLVVHLHTCGSTSCCYFFLQMEKDFYSPFSAFLQPLMVVDFDDDAQNRFIELTESRFSWQLLFRWISKSFILEIDAFISLFTSQNATVIHCAPPRYRPKLKLILHCKPKFLTLTHPFYGKW